MPQLILKLSGEDYYKGLSLQSAFPIGGAWQQLSNYDPFKKLGRLYPTLGPTRKDGGSIAVPVRAFDFYSDGINRYLFGFGNENGGTNGAYKINLDTDAIATLTAVHGNSGSDQQSSTVRIFQGRVVYDQQGGGQSFRSITPSDATDTNLLAGLSGSFAHPSVIGPDGYMYAGNGQYIAFLDSATGAGNNSATKFNSLQSDLICRDLDHDGQYIFAGFDNNPNKLSGISASCQIIVWDRFKSYAEKRYPLQEAYIIAVRCLGQTCFVLTPSGWYVCSIASEPVLLYPMTSESPFNIFPDDFNQVSKNGHSIYWGDKDGSAQVLALGQKIAGKPRIIYNPYEATVTVENQKALIVSNSYTYVSTDINRIYKLNSATGKTVIAKPCPKYLPKPYTFSFTKVVLKTQMASGDEVSHQLNNSNNEIISGSESFNFSNVGVKKTLIFKRIAGGGATINDFTDVVPQITTNCEIAEIEVYGDPLPDTHNQQK